MFSNILTSIALYVLIPIVVTVFSWWLYKEIIKLVKPKTVREKQKTITAWLILVLSLFFIVILGILDNLKVIEPGSFFNLIVVVEIFIIIADVSWISSIYRDIQKNLRRKKVRNEKEEFIQ